jgi:uncharacterized protein
VKQTLFRHPGNRGPARRAALLGLCLAGWLQAHGAAAPPAATAACSDTSSPVQRLICADSQLSQQDQAISALYATAQQQYPDAERKRLKARQGSWLTAREACVNG